MLNIILTPPSRIHLETYWANYLSNLFDYISESEIECQFFMFGVQLSNYNFTKHDFIKVIELNEFIPNRTKILEINSIILSKCEFLTDRDALRNILNNITSINLDDDIEIVNYSENFEFLLLNILSIESTVYNKFLLNVPKEKKDENYFNIEARLKLREYILVLNNCEDLKPAESIARLVNSINTPLEVIIISNNSLFDSNENNESVANLDNFIGLNNNCHVGKKYLMQLLRSAFSIIEINEDENSIVYPLRFCEYDRYFILGGTVLGNGKPCSITISKYYPNYISSNYSLQYYGGGIQKIVNIIELEYFLTDIESFTTDERIKENYLWPRTPLGFDHQEPIKNRVGAYDFEYENVNSRSFKISRVIKRLLADKSIDEQFTLIDIACGDGIVLKTIKECFPYGSIYGIDCLKDVFGSHVEVANSGVKLYKGLLQDFFNKDLINKIDISVMLNTYRGWDNADLNNQDFNLPLMADLWFLNNSKFTILTATLSQIDRFTKIGFNVEVFGRGEDDSLLVLLLPK